MPLRRNIRSVSLAAAGLWWIAIGAAQDHQPAVRVKIRTASVARQLNTEAEGRRIREPNASAGATATMVSQPGVIREPGIPQAATDSSAEQFTARRFSDFVQRAPPERLNPPTPPIREPGRGIPASREAIPRPTSPPIATNLTDAPSGGATKYAWKEEVTKPQFRDKPSMDLDLSALVPAALQNSKQIQVAQLTPFIERELVTQADARFDWITFVRQQYVDTDQPQGTQFQPGVDRFRLRQENLTVDGGARRTNRAGGQFEASQSLQLLQSNLPNFSPNHQGITQLTLRYNQPLLRDGGTLVNEGQVILAEIGADVSSANAQTQISDVLLKVLQAYWDVYRRRAEYCILKERVRSNDRLLGELNKRRRIDAQRSLVAQVESELVGALAELEGAEVLVRQAQHELVRQTGNRTLDGARELIPHEEPLTEPVPLEMQTAFGIALQNRPELAAAVKKIRGSELGRDIAQHQLLPQLAMILETNAHGLNGRFDVFQSLLDQVSVGNPSYTIGFQYEFPIGNRAAQSRARQAEITLRREVAGFEDVIDQIRKEVRDAMAALEGLVKQMEFREESVRQVNVEIESMEARRNLYPDELDRVSQLYIRQYLDALNRRALAEKALIGAQVDYAVAVVQLRRSTGTLFTMSPPQVAASPATVDQNSPNDYPLTGGSAASDAERARIPAK